MLIEITWLNKLIGITWLIKMIELIRLIKFGKSAVQRNSFHASRPSLSASHGLLLSPAVTPQLATHNPVFPFFELNKLNQLFNSIN